MIAAPSNSTRISKRFAELRDSGELGIVAYITAAIRRSTQRKICAGASRSRG